MPRIGSLSPHNAEVSFDVPVKVHTVGDCYNIKGAYLAINNKGKVSASPFEDGVVPTEAKAIPAWLGAEHGGDTFGRNTVLG
ncbi:hypothetical protein OS189_14945 [Sulfitobacter sp. F26169L]|uniref:hypothetical protein n=1 Tax=Sulfitobacter sp. F26169L TaxID=2996015 RepID=UPI002260A9EA|nr:hypothetical protein [Sulfitobacter sp. F26169L]MCX7567642.1 hypothetical protein [Sulfitobacter sp. F26169L]